MAQISLTLKNVECYGTTTKTDVVGTSNITVSSEITYSNTVQLSSTNKESSGSGDIFLMIDSKNSIIKQYTLFLVNLSFLKKMYQPAEVNAEIHIKGDSSIPLSVLEKTFKHINIILKCDGKSIGSGYYVHEVQALYKKDGMFVTLKIFTLDKLLTINKVSRAFVAQKLSSILTTELENYKAPYVATTEGLSFGATLTKLEADTKNMKVLNYTKNSTSSEHIFPYLVQYNESFYDMLARTTNRWGEFMYYEDGQLHIGYDKSKGADTVSNYAERYYFDVYDSANGKDLVVSQTGNYDVLASNDKQFIDTTLKKTPNEISGIMYCPNGKFDKVAMKKLAEFFRNDQSLPAFIVNEIVDDCLEIASKTVQRDHANDKFDNKYFTGSTKPGVTEQYGTYNFGTTEKPDNKPGYNQFTEINTDYDDSKYKEILSKEKVAGQNALNINFETTYPNLKLGQMIQIDGENYIVVEVSCNKKSSEDYKLTEVEGKTPKEYQLEKTITYNYVFNVVALAQDGTNEKVFYPAIIPAGHVRLAEPQIATITDASDPSGNNQVRVVFPWQYDAKTKISGAPKKPKDAAKEATPWLRFTTNASGSPIVGKHYVDNKVLVGFINGNVERPYVLGGLEAKGDKGADVIQTTPGGHTLKINDDPSGVSKFLTGMFLPGWKTLSAFVPQMGELPETEGETGIKLGGGFELSDYYGIYKISGSTDGRNVSVASPWGDVKINAFTGISISAPNGDVKITGKNVSIEAGNNLTLTSGTNVKKRLWADNWKDFGMNLGGDIAAAVVKKLADLYLNGLISIDLTMIRNVLDIVFRPVEGKLEVKSNRYLMLESGSGQCSYPETAYKDKETREKLIAKRKETDFRNGLRLESKVLEVAEKIGELAEEYNSQYITAWNNICKKYTKFQNCMDECSRWSDDYTGGVLPKICKSYTELKDKFWADKPGRVSVDELEFDNTTFKAEKEDDVADKFVIAYANVFGNDISDDAKKAAVRKEIFQGRDRARGELIWAAGELRSSIFSFLKVQKGLSEESIKAKVEKINSWTMPSNFINALVKAFSKEKLGDCYYCQLTDNMKDPVALMSKNKNQMNAHLSILKRKASIVWLEEIGFDDSWRKDMPVRDGDGNIQNVKVKAKPARPFDTADIEKEWKWSDYLNSLTAIPKLTPVKFKAGEALKKSAEKWLDNIYFWKNIQENMSWGGAKNGGILLSFDQRTLGFKEKNDTTLKKMDTIAKENLTELDDDPEYGVKTYLANIRDILKTY